MLAKKTLARLLRKQGLSEANLPSDVHEWQKFLIATESVIQEFQNKQTAHEHTLETSHQEMERLHQELAIRSNAELNYERKRFETLAYGLDQSAIVALTDRAGVITHINDKFCEISGYTQEELIGKTHRTVNSGTHSPEFFREMWQTITSGKTWHATVCNRRKDGNLYWVESTILPILDKNGEIVEFLGIRFDITARKEAEESIRTVAGLKQLILDSTNYAVIATDTQGIITTFNATAERLLGYHHTEVIGKVCPILFHLPEEVQTRAEILSRELRKPILSDFSTLVSKALLTGKDENEWTYIRKDGTHFPVHLSVTSLRNEGGKLAGYVALAHDLTEQKRLSVEVEKQKINLVSSAKMAELGTMAGGVAHEINNPLMIINGTVQRMERRLAAPEIDTQALLSDLEKVSKTTLRIAKIVKGLKTFSRSAENDPFEKASTEILITETLSLCGERFRNHGVELRLIPSPPIEIECRAAQISQVLLNLLNNAFDAILNLPEKWVSLEIKPGAPGWVEFRISDSGPGIPPAIAEKIMLPFFTTKDVGKGTGLGLSISKSIIEDHQGRLTLDTSGPNTCFVVTLPLRPCF